MKVEVANPLFALFIPEAEVVRHTFLGKHAQRVFNLVLINLLSNNSG